MDGSSPAHSSQGLASAIVLGADVGRKYCMGALTAVFKADEAETNAHYSVSEWIVEPGFDGVGPHSHEANDEIFYVVDGEPEILIGDCWHNVSRGTFIRISADTTHDFRNRGASTARLFNVFIPGGFERQMPSIVSWFEERGQDSIRGR